MRGGEPGSSATRNTLQPVSRERDGERDASDGDDTSILRYTDTQHQCHTGSLVNTEGLVYSEDPVRMSVFLVRDAGNEKRNCGC